MLIKHAMTLIAVHPSGAEEWQCPICGRRFIIQWPPQYQKMVLVAGDELAYHSCRKGETAVTAPAFNDFIDELFRDS